MSFRGASAPPSALRPTPANDQRRYLQRGARRGPAAARPRSPISPPPPWLQPALGAGSPASTSPATVGSQSVKLPATSVMRIVKVELFAWLTLVKVTTTGSLVPATGAGSS